MSVTQPTFGELRFRLQKEFPGLDPDILDGYLHEAYRDILRALAWRKLRVQSVIQTAAPYSEGTVAVVEGSDTVALDGGVWSSDMTGRAIRIAARNEYYQFTFLGVDSGQLDRGYEGPTAAAASYQIWQNVYVLPSDLHQLLSIRVFGAPRDLDQVSQEYLDELAPHRGELGTPRHYAHHMTDLSVPPRCQVEVYPIPDAVMALPFWYVQDPALPAATSDFYAPWLQPNALLEAVRAAALRQERDYAGSDRAVVAAAAALGSMREQENRRVGAQPLKMAPAFLRRRQGHPRDILP